MIEEFQTAARESFFLDEDENRLPDWHKNEELLSRRANEDDVKPEISKLKHPNSNYRHETSKIVYQYKFCNVLDENKQFVCRFLNYSDGLKIQ